MKLLIDADIIAYQAAAIAEQEGRDRAITNARVMLSDICKALNCKDRQLFLTGEGNFRKEVAVSREYKGNRKDKPKPRHLAAVRESLEDIGAVVAQGIEADDAIATAAVANPKAVICSTDKDFLQVPGMQYNWTNKKKLRVSEENGYYWFCRQCLTGDSADNIPGLKGIGPKKAQALLEPFRHSMEDMWATVHLAYKEAGLGEDYLTEQARLLWLLREDGAHWGLEYNRRFIDGR